MIERGARTQARIIEDLIDISRILTGGLRLNMQDVEISPLLTSALDAVSGAAEAKGIRLWPSWAALRARFLATQVASTRYSGIYCRTQCASVRTEATSECGLFAAMGASKSPFTMPARESHLNNFPTSSTSSDPTKGLNQVAAAQGLGWASPSRATS